MKLLHIFFIDPFHSRSVFLKHIHPLCLLLSVENLFLSTKFLERINAVNTYWLNICGISIVFLFGTDCVKLKPSTSGKEKQKRGWIC